MFETILTRSQSVIKTIYYQDEMKHNLYSFIS